MRGRQARWRHGDTALQPLRIVDHHGTASGPCPAQQKPSIRIQSMSHTVGDRRGMDRVRTLRRRDGSGRDLPARLGPHPLWMSSLSSASVSTDLLRPAGVVGTDSFELLVLHGLGVRPCQTAPRVLSGSTLEQHDSEVRQKAQKPHQNRHARLPFGRLRRSVDVPGVGVPGCGVRGIYADLGEGCPLGWSPASVHLQGEPGREQPGRRTTDIRAVRAFLSEYRTAPRRRRPGSLISLERDDAGRSCSCPTNACPMAVP